MCRLLSATLVACLVVSGCSRPTTKPTVATKNFAGLDDFEIGEPVTSHNLTVFPVLSKTPKNEDRFITLDEGLAAGTVTITEIGASTAANLSGVDPFVEPTVDENVVEGNEDETPFDEDQNVTSDESADTESDPFAESSADVNQLLVLNSSDRPLYIMPGEVISGGMQDRTIGEELVIQPGPNPVSVEVFCVEHGRWQGRSLPATSQILAATVDTKSDDTSFDNLAAKAGSDKFIARVGNLNRGGRLAVQESKDQSVVWNEVAKTHTSLGSTSDTGNFAELYTDQNVAEHLEEFTQALNPIAERERIVGVVIAVDGRMLSADIFESTPLFRKFWPKLLKSYALDALAGEGEIGGESSPPVACTVKDCHKFLKESSEPQAEIGDISPGQAVARRESNHSISFSYYNTEVANSVGSVNKNAAPTGVMGGMGMGGMGGAVHSGAFAK